MPRRHRPGTGRCSSVGLSTGTSWCVGSAAYGEETLRIHPPPFGGRVIDIGCGFRDTTQHLAAVVGPEGSALGVDVSARFIEAATAEAAGVANVEFAVTDVQTTTFGQRFDLAFSRFGTMFFANPVAALRNVRESLVPGGKLVMVVWRSKVENEWVYRGQTITEKFVTKPESYDEPTCGPGPFSMGNADRSAESWWGPASRTSRYAGVTCRC